jgi:hypothetical protein
LKRVKPFDPAAQEIVLLLTLSIIIISKAALEYENDFRRTEAFVQDAQDWLLKSICLEIR